MSLTAGNQDAANKLLDELWKNMGSSDMAELENAIRESRLTEAQIDQLREQITEQMMELLGPVQYILFDIPLWSDLENWVGDQVMGKEMEAARDFVANIELNEDTFEQACEAP